MVNTASNSLNVLASCGFGPVCMVEDDFFEKVDPAKAGELLAQRA
jgi:NADH-quinone oxidoreductase subunit E